ncbi:DsbA family protein [Alkalihalobacillus oceani]|uniref:DsbA family protein n=1 Tax=Halalkalibacter oceani TaxID=1653776 RepID=UPI00203FD436|nr:DsbA family protein [Halalkalibacter oceani]MCM3760889.1 DsbA family protein [Halalkalibacter oceani]
MIKANEVQRMATNTDSLSKRLVWITLLIIAAGVLIVLISSQRNEASQDIRLGAHPDIEGQPTLGEIGAPVSVVEFGDYKCPACKAWDESILPQLTVDYIETGQVKYSYINTLFHGEESGLAALASESVWNQNPEGFWQFHKEIFRQQPPSQNHDESWITPEKLIDIANEVDADIDLEQLAIDLVNQTYIAHVMADQEQVQAFNVSLTPSIVINGTMVEDPFDYEHMKQVIEEALEEQ